MTYTTHSNIQGGAVFAGLDTTTFTNVVFMNNMAQDVSVLFFFVAIKLENSSIITLSNCSFWNNSAFMGSAISINNTKLIVDGVEASFVNNTGSGPPINSMSSEINITQASFAGNKVSQYGTAISLFNSAIEFVDVHIIQSAPVKRRRHLASDNDSIDICDIYVSVYANGISRNSSCINIGGSNKSFSVMDLGTDCLAQQPTVPTTPVASFPNTPTIGAPHNLPTNMAPVPRPSTTPAPLGAPLSSRTSMAPVPRQSTTSAPLDAPLKLPTNMAPVPRPSTTPAPLGAPPSTTPAPSPSCFSGWNTVEVQNIGIIWMHQLQIGALVKSVNGKFTQVYGFSHYDVNREDTFLRICFNSSSDTKDTAYLMSPCLEISPRHLVMVDKMSKHVPTQAAHVMVGDILYGKDVKEIYSIVRRGVYAPLTHSGDINVSGVLASNYVDVLNNDPILWNQHILGHVMFFRQRPFVTSLLRFAKMKHISMDTDT